MFGDVNNSENVQSFCKQNGSLLGKKAALPYEDTQQCLNCGWSGQGRLLLPLLLVCRKGCRVVLGYTDLRMSSLDPRQCGNLILAGDEWQQI